MESEKFKLGERYASKVNYIAFDCEYEIIKKNKTTCWVKLWEGGKPTSKVYKNVRYNVLRGK